jgi:hypothetical protein
MDNKYIIESFLQAARNDIFQHCWMTAETWAELIARHYKLPESTCYNGQKLVNAIGRCKWLNPLIESTGVINDNLSLFRNKHRPKGGKIMYCFYAAPKGERPTGENAHATWYLKVTKELLNIKVTRSTSLNLDVSISLLETANEVTRKRKKPQNESTNVTLGKKIHPALDFKSSGTLPSSSAYSPSPLLNQPISWFDSPEAKTMFRTKLDEENALEAIQNQLKLLCKANGSPEGYLELIEGGEDEELLEYLSEHQKYKIKLKRVILIFALQSAAENMPEKTWRQCCIEAIAKANNIGLTAIKNPQTIEQWYRKFRIARQLTSGTLPGKHNLPPFLQQNKDVSIKIQQYARENLPQLSVEFIMEYLHDKILPQLICQSTGAVPEDDQYENDK